MSTLSNQEMDILTGVITGDSPVEIADYLSLPSRSNVDEAMRNIRRKYGAKTSAQAVSIAIKRGDIVCRVLRIKERLTDEEREILNDIADGSTAKEIAKRLFYTPPVIEKKLNEHILPKMGAASWEHAVYLGFCSRILSYGGRKQKGLAVEDRRILIAFVESRTNQEAARKLGISLSTYNKHAKRVWGRLDADNMVHAVMRAMQRRELPDFHTRVNLKLQLEELEVRAYRRVAHGMSQPEAGKSLGISERKVNELLASAQKKLGARHLAHGVVLLFQCGVFR